MARDLLLAISSEPRARRLVQRLGLPLPLPQRLDRNDEAYEEQPLRDRRVLTLGTFRGELGRALAHVLVEAGASPVVATDTDVFDAPGEAWGRRPSAPDPESTERYDALVFDASELGGPEDLRALYDGFHAWVGRLRPCAHVVVVGRPPEEASSAAAAGARHGLDGFVRSLAKELGRRGTTANLVLCETGAESRLDGVLRFLLTERSAFVTAQPFVVKRLAKAPVAVPRTRPLEGKTALVTGAARGIGAATAARLAREGAKVLLLDRPDDDGPLAATAREVGGIPVLLDVTAPDAEAKLLAVAKEHGGFDVVVHNAGITRDKTLAKMKPEQWDLAVDVNLGAVVRLTDALVKQKALSAGARVVLLSSVSGLAGNVGQTNYAASKSGLVGYLRHLAPAVADRGITVNAIAPGFIETRLTDAMPVAIREAARRLSALGQGGQPGDVAEAITFLATPGSVGISGAVVRVCGGALVGA
ncbi:MAG: 3-oxoacyl-ACP reductase [Sandaracinus sp.]|nr:3-oxoacyl-ACP reductase [Sandaracinus sp.]MCB9620418.1 3-oxoacyl-ACP reductase [Sandaracinus sp.]